MKPFTPANKKICQLCGEEFWPETRAQLCCKKDHFLPCPICGANVKIKYKSDRAKCCSKKCTLELRKRTNLMNWGVDNPAKCQVIKDKQAETCLERYGVSTPFLMDDFLDKSKSTCQAKYGVDFAKQSEEVQAKYRATCQAKYGVDAATQIPYVREALLDKYSDPTAVKQAAEKRWASAKVAANDGTLLDSNYEKIVYEFCLRNNLAMKRQIPIQFEYEGQSHVTFIDFEISGHLVECKGSHLLTGCYDHSKHMLPIHVKLDIYKKHKVIVITDTVNLDTDMFNEELVGVDIALFDKPKFPYRVDRPELFYHVKVNGNQSCADAFDNELVRWKMILNRAKYVGGWIDNKKILTALNVTKTAKQPSWFSKDFAKRLITTYCTSDIIVDPFAGWGTRHDAACELHKTYIGIDLNAELVKWHNLHNRPNISYGDARTYCNNSNVSVLMCPPYYDAAEHETVEDYNYAEFDDSVKSISECDWLDTVMKNIPNASEYIMVCKTVDSRFSNYVKEIKLNKSHLGSNCEYVVVVPGHVVDSL